METLNYPHHPQNQSKKRSPAEIEAQMTKICPGTPSADEAQKAAEMGTVIRKLTQDEYERPFRHGLKVADGFPYAYYSEDFDYIGYMRSRWAGS